jgi:hypothetical protein
MGKRKVMTLAEKYEQKLKREHLPYTADKTGILT